MNILTFDIEDWFHILDNPFTKDVKQWNNFESRIHHNMNSIFEIISDSNVSATFFVVGWIAKKYPEIVRKISEKGFEVGSHTHLHQLAYNQSRKTFFNDVNTSVKILEDCIGAKVTCFRAPGFSIIDKNKWAFEVLSDLGITTDSSIFPAKRAHGGFANFPITKPSLINLNGIIIKEFPINTHSLMGKRFIFSGGGYFRLLPYSLIKSLTKKSDYIMSYFHPRDFDYEQPMIPGLSIFRKFKSYVGLKQCRPKLEKWLNDFNFIDLKEADSLINWNQQKEVNL